MIISKGRQWDRETRRIILENMEIALKRNDISMVKELATTSSFLADRIKKHDYKKEDEEWRIADEIEAKATRLWKELHS